MFNTQAVFRSCYIVNRPVEPTEQLRETNEIKINFNDGTSSLYLMSDLIKLKGIKAILNSTAQEIQPSSKEYREREITLQESSPEMFAVAKALILEREPFYEVFSEESFDDPFLFEELSKILLYFHLEDGQALIDHLLKDQLPFMPYEIAKRTMRAFEEMRTQHPSMLEDNEGKPLPEPATVAVAKQIIFNSNFLSESECSEYFDSLKEFQQEKLACEYLSEELREQLPKLRNEVEKTIITSQILNYKQTISYCEKNLGILLRKTDLKALPMMSRQHLSARANHPDPKIADLAKESQIILDEYKKNVLKGLEYCRADLSRKDLLDYVIGPKGYLFDDYGFFIDYRQNFPKSAFFHPSSNQLSFAYSLANESARQLEGEIREDLLTATPDYVLPDHFIKDKTITKPVTPEVAKLRDTLLPVLKNWSTATAEQKNIVLTALLEHNEWNKFDIVPSDLTLVCENISEDSAIKGTLQKFRNTFPVHFKLTDCVLLIPKNAKHKHPDKSTTATLLDQARYNRYYRYGDEYPRTFIGVTFA